MAPGRAFPLVCVVVCLVLLVSPATAAGDTRRMNFFSKIFTRDEKAAFNFLFLNDIHMLPDIPSYDGMGGTAELYTLAPHLQQLRTVLDGAGTTVHLIVLGGDMLGHGLVQMEDEEDEDSKDIGVKFLDHMMGHIRRVFPTVPVVFSLGNNDHTRLYDAVETNELDLLMKRQHPSSVAGKKGNGWFYYDQPKSHTRFVVLNSVVLSDEHHSCKSEKELGVQQINWLDSVLEDTDKETKVIIVGHIPPGVATSNLVRKIKLGPDSLWQSDCQLQFDEVLKKHHTKVAAFLAGHTHMDEFRQFPASLVPVFISPAMSSVYGNRHSARVYRVSDAGSLVDFDQYYLDGWAWHAYSFKNAYNVASLSGDAVQKLITLLASPSSLEDPVESNLDYRDIYNQNYFTQWQDRFASSTLLPAKIIFTQTQMDQVFCGALSLKVDDVKTCIKKVVLNVRQSSREQEDLVYRIKQYNLRFPKKPFQLQLLEMTKHGSLMKSNSVLKKKPSFQRRSLSVATDIGSSVEIPKRGASSSMLGVNSTSESGAPLLVMAFQSFEFDVNPTIERLVASAPLHVDEKFGASRLMVRMALRLKLQQLEVSTLLELAELFDTHPDDRAAAEALGLVDPEPPSEPPSLPYNLDDESDIVFTVEDDEERDTVSGEKRPRLFGFDDPLVEEDDTVPLSQSQTTLVQGLLDHDTGLNTSPLGVEKDAPLTKVSGMEDELTQLDLLIEQQKQKLANMEKSDSLVEAEKDSPSAKLSGMEDELTQHELLLEQQKHASLHSSFSSSNSSFNFSSEDEEEDKYPIVFDPWRGRIPPHIPVNDPNAAMAQAGLLHSAAALYLRTYNVVIKDKPAVVLGKDSVVDDDDRPALASRVQTCVQIPHYPGASRVAIQFTNTDALSSSGSPRTPTMDEFPENLPFELANLPTDITLESMRSHTWVGNSEMSNFRQCFDVALNEARDLGREARLEVKFGTDVVPAVLPFDPLPLSRVVDFSTSELEKLVHGLKLYGFEDTLLSSLADILVASQKNFADDELFALDAARLTGDLAATSDLFRVLPELHLEEIRKTQPATEPSPAALSSDPGSAAEMWRRVAFLIKSLHSKIHALAPRGVEPIDVWLARLLQRYTQEDPNPPKFLWCGDIDMLQATDSDDFAYPTRLALGLTRNMVSLNIHNSIRLTKYLLPRDLNSRTVCLAFGDDLETLGGLGEVAVSVAHVRDKRVGTQRFYDHLIDLESSKPRHSGSLVFLTGNLAPPEFLNIPLDRVSALTYFGTPATDGLYSHTASWLKLMDEDPSTVHEDKDVTQYIRQNIQTLYMNDRIVSHYELLLEQTLVNIARLTHDRSNMFLDEVFAPPILQVQPCRSLTQFNILEPFEPANPLPGYVARWTFFMELDDRFINTKPLQVLVIVNSRKKNEEVGIEDFMTMYHTARKTKLRTQYIFPKGAQWEAVKKVVSDFLDFIEFDYLDTDLVEPLELGTLDLSLGHMLCHEHSPLRDSFCPLSHNTVCESILVGSRKSDRGIGDLSDLLNAVMSF